MRKRIISAVVVAAFLAGLCGCSLAKEDSSKLNATGEDTKQNIEASVSDKTESSETQAVSTSTLEETSVSTSEDSLLSGKLEDDRIALSNSDEKAIYVGYLEAYGQVNLVAYRTSSTDEGKSDVEFLITRDGEILYTLPEAGDFWLLDHIEGVEFKDIDGDGDTDIIASISYMTGIGPEGAIPFTVDKAFVAEDKEFRYLSDYKSSEDKESKASPMMTDYELCEDILNAYLGGEMGEDVFCVWGQTPLYGPSFAVLDVNNDNKMDLIVKGPIGIRALEETQFFISTDNGMVCQYYMGCITGIYNDFIMMEGDDHDVTASYFYNDLFGLSFDEEGCASSHFVYSTTEKWRDSETLEEYDEAEIEITRCTLNSQESTKEEIDEYIAGAIKVETPVFYEMTAENIEKYKNGSK